MRFGSRLLFACAVAITWGADSSAAQSIAGRCPVFPANNIWNARVDSLPLHARSADWVETIGETSTLHQDFGSVVWQGMEAGYRVNLVPGTQPKVPIELASEESDPGPYPIPANPMIETNSDRHMLILDIDNCILYETFDTTRTDTGGWRASSGAIFDLRSNALRPEGFTSADAAGLPILAGMARYEEILAGEIRHALRFTAPFTQRLFLWPARHYASYNTNPYLPPMGARFRLKASFDISGFSPVTRIILTALKRYGMYLADNGGAWYMQGDHDARWPDLADEWRSIPGSAFEVVDTSELMINSDSGEARGPVVAASLDSVAFPANSVTGGATAPLRVNLNGAAPSGGAVIALASSNGAVAPVAASATVPAGLSYVDVPVATSAVTSAAAVTITASYTGVSRTASLAVLPPVVAAAALSPSTVGSGQASVLTVTLSGMAPAGGLTVALAATPGSAVTLPGSVTVNAGQNSATANLTGQNVTAATPVTITASALSSSASATLNVTAPSPTVPTTITGPATLTVGQSAAVTVMFSPAGTSPASVVLASSNTAAATVPATATLGAGATSLQFNITAAGAGLATITATLNGVSRSFDVTVSAPQPTPGASTDPAFFSNLPLASYSDGAGSGFRWFGTMVSPNQTLRVTELGRLKIPGNTGVRRVGLFNRWDSTVPVASVTVDLDAVADNQFAYGRLTAPYAMQAGITYFIATEETSAGQPVWMSTNAAVPTHRSDVAQVLAAAAGTATYFGPFWSVKLPFGPVNFKFEGAATGSTAPAPVLAGVTVSPSSVTAGGTATGTVTLTGAASASTVVTLAASGPASVPATVTIASGSSSQTFTVTGGASAGAATITAAAGGVTATAPLTVTAPAPVLSSLSVNPASVATGGSATGMVTLTGAAVSNTVVTLSASGPATAPATVTIAAGSSSQTFPVTGGASAGSVTLTASAGAVTATATLTVTATAPAPAPTLTSVAVNPTSISAGSSATGTVTLSAAAAANTAVTLSISGPASAPGTVTIPAGASSQTFTVSGSAGGSATITASLSGATRSANLQITAAAAPAQSTDDAFFTNIPLTGYQAGPSGGSTNSPRWYGTAITPGKPIRVTQLGRMKAPGNTGSRRVAIFNRYDATVPVAEATVNLDAVADNEFAYAQLTATYDLQSGVTYYIVSQETSSQAVRTAGSGASTPTYRSDMAALLCSVMGPAGGYGAYWGVTLPFGPVNFRFQGTATVASPPAPALSAVTVNPTSVASGGAVTGTVTLTATAQAATVVTLAAAGPASVPASVTVPAGASSQAFTVTATAVSVNSTATITATFGGATRTAGLTVTAPPAPSSSSSGTAFFTNLSLADYTSTLTSGAGWTGTRLEMKAAIRVTELGRMKVAGSSGTRRVAIFDAWNAATPIASVIVNLDSVADGQIAYATLPSPVTLAPNAGANYGQFYIVSEEVNGQPVRTTTRTTAPAVAAGNIATILCSVMGPTGGIGAYWGVTLPFGPVNFKYTMVP